MLTKVSKTNDPERTEWPDSHTRTQRGGLIGRLKATGEGAGLQFTGWIIRRAQRIFKNKRHEVIDSA